MSPFATMILALPAILLEGGVVINLFYTHDPIFSMLIIILGSGVLNFSIFDVICSTTGCPSMLLAILKSWIPSFPRWCLVSTSYDLPSELTVQSACSKRSHWSSRVQGPLEEDFPHAIWRSTRTLCSEMTLRSPSLLQPHVPWHHLWCSCSAVVSLEQAFWVVGYWQGLVPTVLVSILPWLAASPCVRWQSPSSWVHIWQVHALVL